MIALSGSRGGASAIGLALAMLSSCDRPAPDSQPTQLAVLDTLWSATASVDTSEPWIGRVSDLHYLPGSDALLVLDGARKAVVRLSQDGAILAATHPLTGDGPGELRSLEEVASSNGEHFLLDNRRGRILRFDSRGSYVREIELRHRCQSLAALDTMLYCVPGTDGSAFDVYGRHGTYQGGRGRLADLPSASCPENTCDQMPACTFCLLIAASDSTLVVAEATTPSLTEFTRDGAVIHQIALDSLDFVRLWKEQAFRTIESRASERPANVIETKSFIGSIAPFASGSVVLAVLPPTELLRSSGREIWLVDLDSEAIRRFRYMSPDLGQHVATAPDSVIYASNADGSLIVSLRFPSLR